MNSSAIDKHWFFTVRGMHCLKCVRKVQAVGGQFASVKWLEVNLSQQSVSAKADTSFRPESFLKKLEDAGFQGRVAEEAQNQSEHQYSLIRIAVAGAFAGNIMLMSASNYAGADESQIGVIFNWLSLILFLPVLLFSAQPLLNNTWCSLRKQKMSIDTPLTLAIVGASCISCYNLITGRQAVYFDSLSMFIFFLLTARYLIARLQGKYLSPVHLTDIFSKSDISIKRNNELMTISTALIKPSDELQIEQHQYIPVDCEVLDNMIEVDNSIITGESLPVTLNKHSTVFAGAKLLSKTAKLLAKNDIKTSRISSIIENVNQRLENGEQMERFVDRGSNYFALAIVALASVSGLYFYTFNINDGLNRILALLVLACPCGLAIATPLAHSLAVKTGLKKGLLYKTVKAIEELPSINTIIFDKTGTITTGNLEITHWPMGRPNQEEQNIINALEKSSAHPVAHALRRSIHYNENITLSNYQETSGHGVRGDYNGATYELRKKIGSDESIVEMLKNDQLILTAQFADKNKNDVHALIKTLRAAGKNLFLVTGDSRTPALNAGFSAGFKENEIIYDCDPENKAQFVDIKNKANCRTLFIGDGINDALAMSHAHLSCSVQTSAEATFKSSSIHMFSKNLLNLQDLFLISKKCERTIYTNLLISFAYNASFSALALTGLITPLIAVVIMPLSSLSVVFYTLFSMKQRGPL